METSTSADGLPTVPGGVTRANLSAVAPPPGQRRPPRLAEDVADVLRRQILSGEIPDGSLLATQDELAAQFRVSLPSIREALRYLETEGLLTIQRGKIGGSVVRVPGVAKVAYMLGLVLESRRVGVDELVGTMAQIEPLCIRAAALRPDRLDTVVAALEELHAEAEACVEDAPRFARLARRFHEVVIEMCGSEPLIVVVGALESLWWGQVRAAGEEIEFGALPELEMRERSVVEHRTIIDRIAAGDADGAEAAARLHAGDPQRHRLVGAELCVSAGPLRETR